MPDGTKVWMTSVFRILGLTMDGVWAIADENEMGSGSDRPAFGIGTVFAREVSGVGLKIHPDDDPPRHALLLGWDSDKDVRKRVAQDLAEAATAILR